MEKREKLHSWKKKISLLEIKFFLHCPVTDLEFEIICFLLFHWPTLIQNALRPELKIPSRIRTCLFFKNLEAALSKCDNLSRFPLLCLHGRITGTLFHSFDAHHHTRVLIDVQRLEVV